MYIAYSVLRSQTSAPANYAETELNQTLNAGLLQQRYQAYNDVCHKYRHEIAAIQKYLPGWQPALPQL